MAEVTRLRQFPVGTKFTPIGKKYIATVVDYHVTRNLAGDVVKLRYVAEHDFCGQTLRDENVLGITIARGLIS